MAKPKNSYRATYSPEIVKRVCDAIKESGRDVDGFEAAGISKMSFYRWFREKPEFKAAVLAAREEWESVSLPRLRSYARRGLRNTLQAVAEGREIVTTTTTTGIGPEGEIDTETIKRTPAMVPIGQAFTYVMGKEIDLVSWLRQGVDLGVFPSGFVEELIDGIDEVTARIRATVEGRIAGGAGGSGKHRNPGIDPSVAIAAALGLSTIAPVSETVDAGQKPPKNMGKVTTDRG
jgi:AcrR family transcriptional regulator